METIETIAAAWKADKRRWVKDATYAVYLQHLNNHVIPYLKAQGRIDDGTAQEFVDQLEREGLSPKSIRDVTLVMKMLLQFGAKMKRWPAVDTKVRFPDKDARRGRPSVMLPRDQRRLTEHLRDHPSLKGLGVLICLHTGLRIGEVVGLQWRDVDFKADVIRVNKTVQRLYIADDGDRRYFMSIGSPKTASSVREVPMTKELQKIMRRAQSVPEHYVLSGSSRPIEPRVLRDYFTKLLTSLGLSKVRFHALRHSFATRCIESGADPKTVSAILGHSSVSTTLDLYVHPGLEQKKRVIERAARGLG